MERLRRSVAGDERRQPAGPRAADGGRVPAGDRVPAEPAAHGRLRVARRLLQPLQQRVGVSRCLHRSLEKLAEVGNLLACLNGMLEAIQGTNEYITISLSLFQVLGTSLAALFESTSYLLVGNGADEPQLAAWRWMTLGEAKNVECGSTVPLQSTRLTSIFVVVTVRLPPLSHLQKLWRHMLSSEDVATDQVIQALGVVSHALSHIDDRSALPADLPSLPPLARRHQRADAVRPALASPLAATSPAAPPGVVATASLLPRCCSCSRAPSPGCCSVSRPARTPRRVGTTSLSHAVAPLNLQLPGASGAQAFEEASSLIQHEQLQGLSQAILTLLLAMGGYALKGFKQTFAVRQFSSNLVGAVGDRFRSNKAVQRANQYLGGNTVRRSVAGAQA